MIYTHTKNNRDLLLFLNERKTGFYACFAYFIQELLAIFAYIDECRSIHQQQQS